MFQKSGGDRGLSHEHLKAHRVWGEMSVVAVVSMADTRGVRWQLGLPSRGSDEAFFFFFFTFLLINDDALLLPILEHTGDLPVN